MRKIVLVLTAAVMLAAVCFSGCKGAVGIDSGRTKDPIRFTAEPTQAVLPTDLVLPTRTNRYLWSPRTYCVWRRARSW